ncbi:MAG TPA: Rrf2 family transcriptional regulator [Planctomycetota bacterium]|nr:Rrf2 family transcriptional regulator [Planctomycetota bacterium]
MTARSCYSVLAAAALAESHADGRPVPVSVLSERTGAPEDFLVQVLQGLRRAGVVESVRGAAGGFRLAAAPAQVSVGRVLRAAEGSGGFLSAAESCLRATAGAPGGWSDRPLGFVLSEMERSVSMALDGLSLATVLEKASGRRAPPADYQI